MRQAAATARDDADGVRTKVDRALRLGPFLPSPRQMEGSRFPSEQRGRPVLLLDGLQRALYARQRAEEYAIPCESDDAVVAVRH